MRSKLFTSIAILILGISGCSTLTPEKQFEKVRDLFTSLVVVHPTHYFDKEGEAKEAINFLVDAFLKDNKPVYTFVETPDLQAELKGEASLSEKGQLYLSYLPKIKETTLVTSLNGENQLSVSGSHIIVSGGYLLACLRTALRNLLRANLVNKTELNFYLPFRAIYGKEFLKNASYEAFVDYNNIEKQLRSNLPPTVHFKLIVDGKEKVSLNPKGVKRVIIRLKRIPQLFTNTGVNVSH